MDELKPCPFCGGEAEFKPMISNGGHPEQDIGYVRCKSCHAAFGFTTLRKGAIKIWNRRTAPGNNPLSLEQLKQKIHKPVFVVDGNVRTWTLLDRISDDFAYFTESSKCSVGLTLEGLNKAWFPYNAEKQEAKPDESD